MEYWFEIHTPMPHIGFPKLKIVKKRKRDKQWCVSPLLFRSNPRLLYDLHRWKKNRTNITKQHCKTKEGKIFITKLSSAYWKLLLVLNTWNEPQCIAFIYFFNGYNSCGSRKDTCKGELSQGDTTQSNIRDQFTLLIA